jgi:hypothetical protein
VESCPRAPRVLPFSVNALRLTYTCTQELYQSGQDEDQLVSWGVLHHGPPAGGSDEGPRDGIGLVHVAQVNDELMAQPFEVLDDAGADLSRIAGLVIAGFETSACEFRTGECSIRGHLR